MSSPRIVPSPTVVQPVGRRSGGWWRPHWCHRHAWRRPLCLAAAAALLGPASGGFRGPAQAQLAPTQQRGPQSVAPIAEKLIDAVVNISTSQTVKGPQGVPLPKVPKGSPFEDFFEDFFNKKGGKGSAQERKVSSLGSGFVIDGKEGLVVTNNHVIEGADEIIINFHDGSKLKVEKVIGKDTKTDLALLKVRWSPRCIEVVKCDQAVLHVHARAHLGSRPKQDTDTTRLDLAE